MQAFNDYLRQFPHYRPSLFTDILPLLSVIELEAGDYFLQQGRIGKNIAFIETGLIRLFYLHDGKEITTCFCKENTITCSYRSLITNTPSELSIQAIEPCKLVVFSYHSLQQLYQKELFWQQVGRIATEHEFINTECHNRFLNDLSATERYQQVLAEDGELLQRVPLQYLASYLQVAPETLSRIRKKIIRT
ncbi:MAG: Crp/Fnr family transcriptional regulator [Saprospiraceae bacterium]